MTSPEAREPTAIPVDEPAGWLGAAGHLSVLAYPDSSPKSWGRRDQLVTALCVLVHIRRARCADMERVTQSRRTAASDEWLRYVPEMRIRKALTTLSAAERIIFERRIPCANIARRAMLAKAAAATAGNAGLRVTVGGPKSLTALVRSFAVPTDELAGNTNERTLWRYWQASLPVLHLLLAFIDYVRPPTPDDRTGFLVRAIATYEQWLARAINAAELRANVALPYSFDEYEPTRRVRLVAEDPETSRSRITVNPGQ